MFIRVRTLVLSLFIPSLLFAVAACGGGGGGGGSTDLPGGSTPPPTSTLRILATDAPFPFEDVESAIVEVHRVEIRQVGTPFQLLKAYDPPKELDLVDLQNGTVDVLYEGNPAPGTYDAVRIIVTARELTIDDAGTPKTFDDFKVPSGEQTGIKVFIENHIVVSTSLTTDLVLDFDLGRSFVAQGNPNTPAGIKGFHFKPVIRATNVSMAGTLTFRVKSDAGTPGDTTDDFYVNGAAYDVLDNSATPPEIVASGSSGTDPNDSTKDGFVLNPAIRAGIFELTVALADHDDHVQQLVIAAANLTDLDEITLAGTSGMIEGTVTTTVTAQDASTLEYAVEGAQVTATASGDSQPSATDLTSTLGGFDLSPLATGTYDIAAGKSGYSTAVGQASPRVYGAPASRLALKLVPLTANIAGTVTVTNGSPVQGATVVASINGKPISTATTDSSGRYTLAGMPTGQYSITATSATLTASVGHAHVGGGAAATVDLVVQ